MILCELLCSVSCGYGRVGGHRRSFVSCCVVCHVDMDGWEATDDPL